jgi:hypothetical protein
MKENLKSADLTRSPFETYIALVLDSSGSMFSHYDETIRGFNQHLKTIRKRAEHDVYTWLRLFGTVSGMDDLIVRGEVSDLFELSRKNYMPYGSTPLLDAIGGMITELTLDDLMTKGQSFLIIAFSDGQENASCTWDWCKLRHAVLQKDERWTFVFVGPKTEQHKFQKAGFKPENMLDWDDYAVKELMATTNNALGKFLTERNSGLLLPAFFGRPDDEST